jgi:ribonucleoside-triphosphate reductase
MDKTKINWGPIGKEVYDRTYSRVKSDGTKESWLETVTRTVDGNLALVPSKFHMKNERAMLIDLISNFALLPAGRHLWVSGVPGRQFLFNCHTAGWTDNIADHYAFTFDELMKGGGVGANYSNKYISRYSRPINPIELHIVCDPAHKDFERIKGHLSDRFHHEWAGCTTVEDSREGWVSSLRRVFEGAFDKTGGGRRTVLVLDVSRIRPYGSQIRGFGGVASGPLSLILMLVAIAELLNARTMDGRALSSLDHMQVDHEIAKCVVAGNVRRSARMAIKYWADPDILSFIHCKEDEGRTAHFTTNISVEIDNAFISAYRRGDEWAKIVYNECIEALHASGEPGFWNSSLAQIGEVEDVYCTNPCGEISMEEWENCNLGHVNLDAFYDDSEKAKLAFRLMTRFLIRATFGDIGNSLQRDVVKKNRRIGVGFFGYQGWVCKQGVRYSESHCNHAIRTLMRQFYQEIKQEAQEYSHLLRIPCPIKLTTVAPTGTIAKLPGKSEGAQCIYGKYYIRRMRLANTDPQIQFYRDFGYHLEPCVYTPDTTVVSFWCKDRLVEEMEQLGMDVNLVEDQSEVSLEDSLAIQAMLQREFVDNSISFTVNLSEDTPKKKLYHVLLRFLPELKGTTIILGVGDRPQPPYTRLTREEFLAYDGPHMISQTEMECAKGACPIK